VTGAVGVHPVEDRRGHLVARRELVREAPPARVEERCALAPYGLGDEGAVALVARQRQRGGVELAELEVGEPRAGCVGDHRARPDRAPGIAGPRPQRGPAARGEHRGPRPDRPAVRDEPAAPPAVARQRERGGPFDDVDPLVRLGQLGQARGEGPAGLRAAGVHDAPRAVAAL
jgi:hypothetical protein